MANRPEIQYCTTKEGFSIAFYTMGEGPPLVIPSSVNWSHLRLQVVPEYHRAGLGFGRYNRIVRYDSRGTGLSDRSTLDYSLDARVADLEAVVDHLGLERFDLLGHGHGGSGAIGYAVGHSDRVVHLVLARTYASGPEFLRSNAGFEALRATMAFQNWEKFTLLIANNNIGFTDTDLARRMAAVYQEAMTPEGVLAVWKAIEGIDVRPLLARVKVPTLALSTSGGQPILGRRVDWMREIASKIPGARLVETHWDDSTSWGWSEAAFRTVDDFLGVGAEATDAQAPPSPSGTAIILFADMVDSAAITERLGDTAFREKARSLDEAMRAAIRENGGTPVEGKTLGDGVLAVFTSAKQAIACAQACHTAASAAGLALHAGIHAGDVIREADNVYGGAVNIAARIAAASAPGEILVSDTVRSLARTSAGVSFEDRGEQSLKGIEEPVRVFAVFLRER